MNISTIITVATIVAITFILYLVISMRSKNRAKKKLEVLNEFASKHNSGITKNEFCGNISIGLDEKTNHLFFIKNINGIEKFQHVNLSEIKNCKVINTGRTVEFNKSSTTVLEKLQLCFNHINKNLEQIQLEFYNIEYDGSILNGELQLAEKWAGIINSKLGIKN